MSYAESSGRSRKINQIFPVQEKSRARLRVVDLSDLLLLYPARKRRGADRPVVAAKRHVAARREARFARARAVLGGLLERRAPVAARGGHVDAVDRAGRQAQPAAYAPRLDHGVHEALRADDRVDRTGVDAAGAADAARFVDQGDGLALHGAV